MRNLLSQQSNQASYKQQRQLCSAPSLVVTLIFVSICVVLVVYSSVTQRMTFRLDLLSLFSLFSSSTSLSSLYFSPSGYKESPFFLLSLWVIASLLPCAFIMACTRVSFTHFISPFFYSFFFHLHLFLLPQVFSRPPIFFFFFT